MIRICATGCNPEFLNRIDRRTNCSREGRAQQLVVVIHTVQRDISLVASPPIERAVSRIHRDAVVWRSPVTVCVGHERDAGLQAQDTRGVAAFKRQGQNLPRFKGIADRRVRRIDRRRRALRHSDRLVHGAKFEFDVYALRGSDQRFNLVGHRLPEPGRFHANDIRAGL